MAESDPKKIRPFGQSSDRRHLESDEDPLVELARIVSEDSGFYGSRAERPKPHREEAIDRNAYSADLESELLQELESSFSRSTAPRIAPAPREVVPSPRPLADDSDDLLRSIEKQLGEFERRTQATRSAAPAPMPPPEADWDDRTGGYERDEYDPAPEPEEDWSRDRGFEDRRVAEARERIASAGPSEPQDLASERQIADRQDRGAGAPQPRPDARVGRLFAGPRDRDDDDETPIRLPLRRRDPPIETERGFGAPAGFASAAGGWDAIESSDPQAAPASGDRNWPGAQEEFPSELRTSFRDAGARRPERFSGDEVAEQAAFSEEMAPSYADPTLGGHWQDGAGAEYDDADDEPRVAAAAADGLGERRGAAERGRSRAGLLAAAAVLGVVVIGGAAAMYLRGGEEVPSGPPPVIAAPEGDVKVQPEAQAQAEGETVGEAVYNRVAGNAPPAEEQVVDGAEEPREISRIVLPPPQETGDQALVRPVGEAGADAAPAVPEGAPGEVVAATDAGVGPRLVRTYVVRPDGTIEETAGAPAGESASEASAQEQQVAAVAPSEAEPMIPVRVPTTEIDGTGQPQAVQPEFAGLPAAPPSAEAPEPPPAQTAAAPAAPPPAAPAPEPAATTSPPAAEAEPAPTPAAAPAPVADGYLVQISSQRSMADAQATWASAQNRYSSVLGNLEPDIQQADLGAKGVYYRVRVGPWADRGEAVAVCENLRAAGGDCIVTR